MDGGFAHWFPAETWRSVSFFTQVSAWILGFCVIILGATSYFANRNAVFLDSLPRAVSTPPRNEPLSQAKRTSVVVVSIGGQESNAYAATIIPHLESVFHLEYIQITFHPDTPSGLQVFANGNDATPLLSALQRLGLQVAVVDGTPPIPGSVMERYRHFVALVVGPKP